MGTLLSTGDMRRGKSRPAVSALRTATLTNKPHIYLHRYGSGLTFWRAIKPTHRAYLPFPISFRMKAAYQFVSRLNGRKP